MAFDTVNGATMLAGLQSEFSATDVPLSWIDSYLSGRSFFVSVGQSLAPVTQASSSVSQGSVLGPVLFMTYVDSISRLINSYGINYHKYAYDMQVYDTLVKPPENNL